MRRVERIHLGIMKVVRHSQTMKAYIMQNLQLLVVELRTVIYLLSIGSCGITSIVMTLHFNLVRAGISALESTRPCN